MKKIYLIFVILSILLSSTIEAYSTSKYSIDIPSTYSKVSEGAYAKQNGDNINIVVNSYSSQAPSYNEDTLNTLEKMLKTQISNEKDSIIKILKEKSLEYGVELTESQINEYAKSFKINSIEKKELIKCSKNKYDAYHFIASYSFRNFSSYIEQYYIVTKTDLYVISIGSNNKSSFSSTETINMINSFKISNYEKPSTSFFSDKLWGRMIGVGIVAMICGIIKTFFDKNNIKHENNKLAENEKIESEKHRDNQTDNKEKNDDNNKKEIVKNTIENFENKELEIQENKTSNTDDVVENKKNHCVKCGNEVDIEWVFCKYCGNKLK